VKNFSFLLDARNEWIFAPAYDLTFSYGPGGEQSMLVMGEGGNPGAAQLQALGKQHGIKNAQAILAKVKTAVANWRRYAEQAEVSRKSTQEITGKIKLQ
jgi:serine/threonine-protein kinase HipA